MDTCPLAHANSQITIRMAIRMKRGAALPNARVCFRLAVRMCELFEWVRARFGAVLFCPGSVLFCPGGNRRKRRFFVGRNYFSVSQKFGTEKQLTLAK